MEKLKYVKNGKVEYLPTWCMNWTDEAIEKAKKTMISDNTTKNEEIENITINENEIKDELKNEFSKNEIDEIINYIHYGVTIDNAIQRILINR